MKLICPICAHPNPLGTMMCVECSADLTYAFEGPDQIDEPVGAIDTETTAEAEPAPNLEDSETTCSCAFPDGNVGETHFACGGRIAASALPPRQTRPSTTPRQTNPPTPSHQNRHSVDARLLLPGGVYFPIGQGCLLGRGTGEAVTGIQALLKPYSGISRQHAWIGYVDGPLLLIDLDSHNGTWIGEDRLQAWRAHVLPNDVSRIDIGLGATFVLTIERGAHP